MNRKMPSREVGTSAAENNTQAAKADPCCNHCTILTSANEGIGTIQNRKQRGKSREHAALAPKHRTNVPIQRVTRPRMLTERCTSGVAGSHNLAARAIRTPRTAKHGPVRKSQDSMNFKEFHSAQTSAALTGRMRSMCVSSSSRNARASVPINGRHKRAVENMHRHAKVTYCRDVVIKLSGCVSRKVDYVP